VDSFLLLFIDFTDRTTAAFEDIIALGRGDIVAVLLLLKILTK